MSVICGCRLTFNAIFF